VLTASTSEEALAIADDAQPDLIVADLGMPGMDGAELCTRLKQSLLHARIPVVLLSSTGEAAERERAVRAGADDVLPKPIERMALLAAARRFLTYPTPRGQPRIEVAAPAQLSQRRISWDGTARNLSRGGVFVESKRLLRARAELDLEIELPESSHVVASSAQVVWARERGRGSRAGMGLRFLALDRRSARVLADYVDERLPCVRSLLEDCKA